MTFVEFHFHAAVNAWDDTGIAQLSHCVIHGFAVLDTEGEVFSRWAIWEAGGIVMASSKDKATEQTTARREDSHRAVVIFIEASVSGNVSCTSAPFGLDLRDVFAYGLLANQLRPSGLFLG